MTTFSVPWLRKLALVADDFGEDHRNLLDKVNALLLATSSANETQVLMAHSSLRVAAQEHFAREEVQMGALQYPEIQQHCESHRRLLDGLSSLQFMLRNMDGFSRRNTEGFVSTTGLFAFLQRWFEAHLTTDDKKFADFLAQRVPSVAAEVA
jgi:hemerythrin-like metal-binding protein